MQACARQRTAPSGLFSCPGFRLDYIALDSMNCGDLGVFPDAIGGLLYIEMSHRPWHSSFAVGVAWLNKQLKEYYSANPPLTRVQLTVNMIKNRDVAYPTLKCKAAECRHLAGFAVDLAHRHRLRNLQFRNPRLTPFSAEYQRLAVEMAEGLYAYHEACSAEPFSEEACKGSMLQFIKAITDLRGLFRRGLAIELHDSQPFIFRVKGHMLDHMVRESIARWGSPKNFWCYADEDFVGMVKRIAQSSKHPRTVEKTLLAKYRLYGALHAYALEHE